MTAKESLKTRPLSLINQKLNNFFFKLSPNIPIKGKKKETEREKLKLMTFFNQKVFIFAGEAGGCRTKCWCFNIQKIYVSHTKINIIQSTDQIFQVWPCEGFWQRIYCQDMVSPWPLWTLPAEWDILGESRGAKIINIHDAASTHKPINKSTWMLTAFGQEKF